MWPDPSTYVADTSYGIVPTEDGYKDESIQVTDWTAGTMPVTLKDMYTTAFQPNPDIKLPLV